MRAAGCPSPRSWTSTQWSRSELIIVSVPDAELAAVISQVARHLRGCDRSDAGRAHRRAHGTASRPGSRRAVRALPLAPASGDDVRRFDRRHHASGTACFGITAADPIGDAIGASLVMEMGGEPVRIPEDHRTLYHAALAHGANHLIVLISDAVAVLNAAIEGDAMIPGRPMPRSTAMRPGLPSDPRAAGHRIAEQCAGTSRRALDRTRSFG